MNDPLCFVLMPFGKKPGAGGALVDFDAVYERLIAPAVKEAGLEVVRADEELVGGIIHKPMFERLILCEYAVADLTTANANVFYELGVRHAVRPWSTVLLFAEGGRLPFDVEMLRVMPYRLTADGLPVEDSAVKTALVQRLAAVRKAAKDKPPADSPVYQLIEGYPDVQHEKTDVFRDRVRYSEQQKARLAEARRQGTEAAVAAAELGLGPLDKVEAGVLVDLFLSYRAVKAWRRMLELAEKLPRPLAETVMVQEQLALALNRDQQGDRAEKILLELLARRGPSSETYGILGRVYKDRWEAAARQGNSMLARGLLAKAIDAYRKGFEADWRDDYPGINAVTLMEIKEPPDPARLELLPVVGYAVERRIGAGKADYWAYATRLELAVLAQDQERAETAAGDALAVVREKWEPETTSRNLRLIREARERRGEAVPWARAIEAALDERAQS
jgi:tetratricopeptide (TPR) repeat protein